MPHPLFAGTLGEMGAAARAVANDQALTDFWERLAAHAAAMADLGWTPADARAMLVGAVLLPVEVGHADGSLNRRVRGKVSMHRRRLAAACARELADTLDKIATEPLPPDEALGVISLLPERLIANDAPSYCLNERTSDALRRLAAGLEREPDFGEAPGLASRKPSWRDGLREAVTELERLGFKLREIEAVWLVGAYARAVGARPPTRDDVRAALRALESLRAAKGYSDPRTRPK